MRKLMVIAAALLLAGCSDVHNWPMPKSDDVDATRNVLKALNPTERELFLHYLMRERFVIGGMNINGIADNFKPADTVGEAITDQAKFEKDKAAEAAAQKVKDDAEAVEEAKKDCKSTKPDAYGMSMTWKDSGYDLKGKHYAGPCEALQANGVK